MLSARPTFLVGSGVSSPVGLVAPPLPGRSSRRRRLPAESARGARPAPAVQAAVTRTNEKGVATAPSKVKLDGKAPPLPRPGQVIKATAMVTIRLTDASVSPTEWVAEKWKAFMHASGGGLNFQLVSEEIDDGSATHSGKTSKVATPCEWSGGPKPNLEVYRVEFEVPYDFGRPVAILVKNAHEAEAFLAEIVVTGFGEDPIVFPADTWIHSQKDNPDSRIIFTNQAYLPSQTPEGLRDLREKDLNSLRGNGKGERQKYDRIYDYAPYNDLGNPDATGKDLWRPSLGGKKKAYPRRCRTGRPPTKADESCESRAKDSPYVPRDETFEDIKDKDFGIGNIKAALRNAIPTLVDLFIEKDDRFGSFSEVYDLYKEGLAGTHAPTHHGESSSTSMLPKFITWLLNKIMATVPSLKFNLPSIISRDCFTWLNDIEFGRQTLAGMNPVEIKRLKEFPILSKLDPTIYGPPESAITKDIIEQELNGMCVEEAIEKNRLFILDYHDVILPYIERINSLEDSKVYAPRAVFFSSPTGVLKPIVIELSLPPTSSAQRKRVFTRGHDATSLWLWRFAKAHVCAIDAGVHQLVSHWLRTHACMEPYIIASHRQLSELHPIFKLLHPHLRYTMEINAEARQSLINAGGVIETNFSPGKYALEMSSAVYQGHWRFDNEALPANLLQRGMAEEDPASPNGLKLVLEDYPFAADGLLVWSAIEDWVRDYVTHFYPDSHSVTCDEELQAWWEEIKTKGHPDKQNEPWWPNLATREDLVGIVTTMIWTASGQHAAVNFGQYPIGGFMPNRPGLMAKLIPEEGDCEYEDLLRNTEKAFLSSLPTVLQSTMVMAVQGALSSHSSDEEYLGQLPESQATWTNDPKVKAYFNRFSERLKEIEETIRDRNRDPFLKNRNAAGIPPYELLMRSSGPGVTGRGIPNSISI